MESDENGMNLHPDGGKSTHNGVRLPPFVAKSSDNGVRLTSFGEKSSNNGVKLPPIGEKLSKNGVKLPPIVGKSSQNGFKSSPQNGGNITEYGHNSDHKTPDEELTDADDHRYGCWKFRPKWLQVFNNSRFLLMTLCSFTFVLSMVVNGMNGVNTSSYERRFGFTSSQVGLISSAYDIAAGILVLPISYYALQGHKTVMIAAALGVQALGSFLMWLPHITTDRYEWGQSSTTLCTKGNGTACVQTDSGMSTYLYVFMAGNVFHGIAGTTVFSVGTSCLDDNVTARNSPVYIAIFYAFSALGPAAGYMLGGYFLNIYVDINLVDEVLLDSTDPRWVGAWWIGFVISMVLALLLIMPVLGFPRELPGAKAARVSRVSEAHKGRTDGNGGKPQTLSIADSFKHFPRVLWSIIKNPTFIFVSLAFSTEGMLASSFGLFIPKFIQNQYAETASSAALLTGLMAVPGAAGASILGGYICQRFKLKVRGMLLFNTVTCLICMVLLAGFWARCDEVKIAGVNTMYTNSEISMTESNLTSSCNADCRCHQENYSPICGADGVHYFSPCHAGCSRKNGEKYSMCSCINVTFSGPNQTHSAESGMCQSSCSMLYVFLPAFFLAVFFTFLASAPITMITLRCVPDVHKTFALGVQFVFIRFLGTVPGPILFGAVIDNACVLWKRGCVEGETSSCWIYDNAWMATSIFLLSVGVKLLSATFFFVSRLLYKAPSGDKAENSKRKASGSRTQLESVNTISPIVEASNTNGAHMIGSCNKRGIDNPALESD